MYISENANVTLDNLIITGAYSVDLYGGGIRNVGELRIKNCDITGNTAAYGGGIALYDGSPRLYFENTQQIKIQGNEASAGGGAINVKVSGSKEIKEIKIQKDVVDPDDVEMLEDLILTCINEALRRVDSATNQAMGQFNIPGLM